MDWVHIGEPDIQSYTPLERRVLELLNEGKNHFSIAASVHLSFEAVREVIFNIRKKESVKMAKLTNTQRTAIYQAWKEGTPIKVLANQYGVSCKTLYNLTSKMNRQSELEDCEDGIPNTPLEPAAIEKEISAITEDNNVNAQPADIPECVMRTVDQRIRDCEEEISMREERICELKDEIETFGEELCELKVWRYKQP